ncbi:flagellar motor protein PomA [Pseudoalteromonas sp. MMG013]|uniref:Chemotaxis protein MotA n=1 Tax=Pseudoalteromonas aurantia 208 TaxID=1314867 RepID=A0ABR9EBR1_9GAMM|nr:MULTISPECIES: flagellar motor protein PomA [Pseudoalteromonas]MBE0367203.1 chemotaxis protein MotA [Pseudoalteromonas aurantia 208]MBQ4845726.1 flagellar motor protein PomA [Pseudoalteromonas sp. MMG005]MBQ4850760.1 flagellar motor protein PomA [Pseudoalteromonas sp. MMG012]MBQ4861686.1 flagellar motor protein PomA [Pseudoalteromonas sp. MMG013]
MDLATVIGILGAIGLIAMSMFMSSDGEVAMFADSASAVIVFGGSLFIVLSNFTMPQFFGIGKVMGKAFMFKIETPEELIEKAVELADSARKGGFLALEEAEIPNAFMRKGVDMLVDGHDADVVRATLQKDISLTSSRHEQGASLFKSLADIAPAMGMIGTLIGLVAMLSNMDDPKAIGPAMAVALLTTLYGAFLANVVAIPIQVKLELRKDEEEQNQRLILDAILGIQDGQNPKVIEGILKNYLAESKRGTDKEE